MKTIDQCSYSDIRGCSVDEVHQFWGNRIKKFEKSKRIICPICKRRLMSAVRYCHDGCCIIHCIPQHKKKNWFKRKRLKHENKRRRN